MVKVDKNISQRLAYIKFILQLGLNNSQKPYPYSSASILNFHDAVEFLMYLVAEVTDSKQSDSVVKYFDNISKSGKGIGLKGKSGIKKLVKVRNNLKHESFIPTHEQIEECTTAVLYYFEKNVYLVFGKELDDINMVDLVKDDEIREHVKTAEQEMKKSNSIKSREELALAFWKLIDKTEDEFRTFGESPFNFGSDMTFLPSFFVGVDRQDKLNDFIDKVGNSVSKMKDAMRIISLGLDYRKFVKFTSLTPLPRRTLGGTYHTDIGSRMANATFTQAQFDFCLNFIVEEYFVLSEF